MYKVYHDPEGKSVMTTQQNTYAFQYSEEMYKEQIEKLRKENTYLKTKVSIILYIANCSRWKSFADGQGTSNSLENFHGSFTPVKMCSRA